MHIDENTTLKELWDNEFQVYYCGGTEDEKLVVAQCRKCGSKLTQDRLGTMRCTDCDWGN